MESGRADAASGERLPWPWAVNAEGRGMLFDSREEALAWVRRAEASGVRSIDVGCLQVNRLHHPQAFVSLDLAFAPATNADYAARFLRALREGPAGGDWMKAAGFYHSQTPERAAAYRARVEAELARRPAVAAAQPPLPMPGGRTAGGGGTVLPPVAGTVGRDLAQYRRQPVMLAAWRPAVAPSPAPSGIPARPRSGTPLPAQRR